MARILLVDDDPVTLRIIRSMLQKREYDTLGANSVKEAVKLLETDSSIDVVVADIVMPKATGFDLIKHMAKTPRLSAIPVILCSSRGDKETLMEGMGSGARDFIVKPFKAEVLAAKIEKALCQGKPGILVIEDEKLIRDRLAYIIELEGFNTYTAETAEEGLRLMEEHRVDVVIADIGLPGMTGMTFTEKIKRTYGRVPVLVITGLSNQFTSDIASSVGADGYITKPFRNTEIIEQLRNLIKEMREKPQDYASNSTGKIKIPQPE
ncbi:response regulator [candidate division GN15 bacterium]|nr:response regulator [candidate division GN15 bacterium]